MAELTGEPIDRKRGDTAPDKIIVIDIETGAPLDNTGYSYQLTINTDRNPDPGNSIGSQLVSIAGTPAGVSGAVEFPWTGAGDADQEPGEYWYDVQQTDAGGLVKTILKNTYTFHMDVTK
jgi:hypothetical protein